MGRDFLFCVRKELQKRNKLEYFFNFLIPQKHACLRRKGL